MTDTTSGLNCPKCGGTIAVPEGRAIVECPYCELRSVVRGERGVRRYQLPCRVDRQRAIDAFQGFLSGNMAIARDALRQAKVSESFIAYLPFWMAWGRGLGWTLGEKRVGSGEHKRYEPREVRIVEELNWNGAACDVGEFGVNQVPYANQPLEPFQAEALHRAGLVFEPVGLPSEARKMAGEEFSRHIASKGRLDRVSQTFQRVVRMRLGLVYYPLWVLRYAYRGRSFQVAIDGSTGKVLYGKAPGNTLYRAAVLVGGMAVGAFLAVDVPALLFSFADGDSAEGLVAVALGAFVVGLGMMWAAFRKFRYGEQFEYRQGSQGSMMDSLRSLGNPDELFRQLTEKIQ